MHTHTSKQRIKTREIHVGILPLGLKEQFHVVCVCVCVCLFVCLFVLLGSCFLPTWFQIAQNCVWLCVCVSAHCICTSLFQSITMAESTNWHKKCLTKWSGVYKNYLHSLYPSLPPTSSLPPRCLPNGGGGTHLLFPEGEGLVPDSTGVPKVPRDQQPWESLVCRLLANDVIIIALTVM